MGHADGTLESGATIASALVNQGFALDGGDDFIDLGNASALQVSAGDFSVDAWVFFNDRQGDMSIVDKMSAAGVNLDGWRLLKQNDDRFWFCFGGGTDNHCVDPAFTVFSSTVVSVGAWFNVAAVKSSTSFALYVNGELEDVRSPIPAFVDTGSANLRVGSYVLQGSYLNGLVDEVELFNRALSSGEIRSMFEAGSSQRCK